MSQKRFVDFRKVDIEKLRYANPGKAVWGTMSYHQMIEHLYTTMKLSLQSGFPENYEHGKYQKAREVLLSDQPLPKNYKATYWPEIKTTNYPNVDTSVLELAFYIDQFEQNFEKHKDFQIFHPNFGALDKKLAFRLQDKHFTHHLEQFNLI